jgi:hypothetical protein
MNKIKILNEDLVDVNKSVNDSQEFIGCFPKKY